jgi:CubicO group peptidase (beta-lactamase class C family)
MALLLASVAFSASAPLQPPAGWAAVARDYRGALQRAGVVGSSLMLLQNGRVLARENAGLQDSSSGRPIDDDTIYHWASITKTFTGIAIMQLRDRGLLSLDDPAVKYVPELRLAHDPYGPIEDVKIRYLMSHSAGFRAATWPWGGDQPWQPFEPTRWQQIVAMMPYTELQFGPGTRYSYSNPGVIFLGRIIEQLTGDDYEMYVTKNILMPLGMRSSFFDRAPYYLLPNRSHSYFRDDHGVREGRFDFDTGITVSNGGLNAPFGDMAKYIAFLQGDATNRADYDIVLKRASLEEMWAPQISAREGEGTNGADSHAALSFFVERYGDIELIGHSGDQNGFISHLYLNRASGFAWLISMNTDVTATPDRPGSRQVDAAVRDSMIRNVLAREK